MKHQFPNFVIDLGNVISFISLQFLKQSSSNEVTNVGIGTIVSGNVAFEGIVSDGNGIKSMAYSLDAGKEFFDVKVANDKKTNSLMK